MLRLRVRAPAAAPRDVYHLRVFGPAGLGGLKIFSVRVLGEESGDFRFAFIGDSQVRDPSTSLSGGALNSGDWPRCCEDEPESMLAQQVQELSFLDPDFVLYAGDLVFGVDYATEFSQTLGHWWSRPLATFFVPGNHDGLALYELAFKPDWWLGVLESLRCAKPLLDGQRDAQTVFQVLKCALRDLEKILFQRLRQDGLDWWRRLLGPPDFSFDASGVHFVGLNSYSGSAERRHAFTISLEGLGIDFGVSAVDNYGGTLTAGQLDWLERDLGAAATRSKSTVLLLHHDPRGCRDEPWGRRYHANLPFPTQPLGLGSFQEWNFDGPEWNSATTKPGGGESQEQNSATRLLEEIAGHVDLMLTGHIHRDIDEVIEAGGELVPASGIRTSHRLRSVRVTYASSTTIEDGYWGYRLFHVSDGQVDGGRYDPKLGWPSLPSGNLWVEGSGECIDSGGAPFGGPLFVLHNGLPQPISGRLRARLPDWPEGITLLASGGQVGLVDAGPPEGGSRLYHLRAEVPGVRCGRFPVPAGEHEVLKIGFKRAEGNRPPEARLDLPWWVRPGEEIELSAVGSSDPDGDEIIRTLWEFGDGGSARGQKARHAFKLAGEYRLHLSLMDAHGAESRLQASVTVGRLPPLGKVALVLAGALVLFAAFLLLLRRRRRARKTN